MILNTISTKAQIVYVSSVSLLEAIKSTQWTRPCCEELQLCELTIVVMTHLVPIPISNTSTHCGKRLLISGTWREVCDPVSPSYFMVTLAMHIGKKDNTDNTCACMGCIVIHIGKQYLKLSWAIVEHMFILSHYYVYYSFQIWRNVSQRKKSHQT